MLATLLILAQQAAPVAPTAELPAELVPASWLCVPALDATGRRPFSPNTVFARHLLAADAAPPVEGAAITGSNGREERWKRVASAADGRVDSEAAWAYAEVESPARRVLLAELAGAGRLYVNGAGFAGDVYGYGFGGVPVALQAGVNRLYVTGIRGRFRLKLRAPPAAPGASAPLVFGDWDVTRPELVRGERAGLKHLGLLLLNASEAPLPVVFGVGGDTPLFQRGTNSGPTLVPLGVDKALFELLLLKPAPATGERVEVPLTLNGRAQPLELTLRAAAEVRRLTFPSRLDGSVQECSVLPAAEPAGSSRSPGSTASTEGAVVLSLHGAGVDARNQAASYAAKPRLTIVAPTNRRPFGFDWQDWGRRDAYEALAAALYPQNAERFTVYLTGHSMGGHGTWHLAANDPDRFAAIAPSAGWSSFEHYGGGARDGELAAWWRAADPSSDTLALMANLARIPTFVLHGADDDNVPASEAERMLAALRAAGGEPRSHIEPGAGHWWDKSPGGGADCLDWPGIFELFAATRAREIPAQMEFLTVDPGVDAVHGWLELLQAQDYAKPLRVRSRLAQDGRELVLETENVRALRFRGAPAGWSGERLNLDGQSIQLGAAVLAQDFLRGESSWQAAAPGFRLPREKNPEFSGPFKRAFERGFVLVYGTAGSEAEDRALLERARCDAATWWYRGNGSARLVSDQEFLARGEAWTFGMELGAWVPNVVLYGNADTNGAWRKLLGEAPPVDARRGALRCGTREWRGDDLAGLFVLPRRDVQGDVVALIGACADSGPAGARLGYALAPFASGVGTPDFTLFSARVLAQGDGGVLATGFFDARWQLDGRAFLRPESPAGETPR